MLFYFKNMCYDIVTAVRFITEFTNIEREKEMMKKRLAALLACTVCVTAFAACGKEESDLAEATVKPGVDVVAVEGDETDVSLLPLEDYITLGDYKNLSISVAPKTELSEEELDAYVQSYFYNDAMYIAPEDFLTEGVVKEGDVVLMDYEGKKDDVAFEGGSATDAMLGIGSGNFIDGFEDGLVGVSVGETVELPLTFPEVYQNNPDLAGAEVVFTVTVKGIATLSDEMVVAMGIDGYETLEDYSNAVKLRIVYENEQAYYSDVDTALRQALVESSEIHAIPESIYEQQRQLVIDQVVSEATAYGYDGDTYTQAYTGMNLADYAITVAERYTTQTIALQAVANAEGIEITQENIDTFVNDYVANYGATYGIDSVETFYKYNTEDDVRNLLLQDKVVTLLMETATITDAE